MSTSTDISYRMPPDAGFKLESSEETVLTKLSRLRILNMDLTRTKSSQRSLITRGCRFLKEVFKAKTLTKMALAGFTCELWEIHPVWLGRATLHSSVFSNEH